MDDDIKGKDLIKRYSDKNENENEFKDLDLLMSDIDKEFKLVNELSNKYKVKETNFNNQNNKDNFQTPVLFSNSFIKNQLDKANALKNMLKLIDRKVAVKYIFKWRNNIIYNNNNKYLLRNKNVIETFFNNNTEHENLNESLSDEDDNYYFNNYVKKEEKQANINARLISFSVLLFGKLKSLVKFDKFVTFSKLRAFSFNKKHIESNLTMIYLFTELTISKQKLKKKILNESNSNNSNYYNVNDRKIVDFEAKITKLENNLTEKVGIILKKNDMIENLSDQIEILTKKISKLEQQNLNIVQGNFYCFLIF